MNVKWLPLNVHTIQLPQSVLPKTVLQLHLSFHVLPILLASTLDLAKPIQKHLLVQMLDVLTLLVPHLLSIA